jgi:hypothetical protein
LRSETRLRAQPQGGRLKADAGIAPLQTDSSIPANHFAFIILHFAF